jgi:hypothetical protein
VGTVRDIWEAAAQLGTLKGLLFVCSLAVFIDVGLVHLRMGNLMSIDWHTPPGPGPLLWGLATFIAMPLLVATVLQGLLGVTVGHMLWRWFHGEDMDPPRDDELLAHQLMELALFEKDTQLEAYVRRFMERWSLANDEGDKLMQQSWACTLWMVIAFFTPTTWFHSAVVGAWSSNGFGCLLVMAGGAVVCAPWFLHLAADPLPLRHIYVRGARARFQRMCANELVVPAYADDDRMGP